MININDCLSSKNSVYIVSADGKELVAHNIYAPFRSASIIKLFILAYYLENEYDFDEVISIPSEEMIDYSDITELGMSEATLRALLVLMIASSDNTAANVLIKKAGMEAINTFLREKLCVRETVIGRIMLDYKAAKEGRDNITCLFDVKKCLDVCLSHELGKRALGAQKCRDRILRYIYSDVEFYGKAGEIPKVYNDVGYLNGAFVGVLTYGMTRTAAAELCGIAGLVALGSETDSVVI